MTLKTARPEAVLFDLDGTLVDTAEEFELVLQAMRADRNLPPLLKQAIRASVSNGAAALVTLAFDCPADSTGHEELRQEFLDRYEKSLGLAARPYPGLRDLISALGTAGIPWGVVTNKFRRFAEPLMAALDFDPAARALVTPCDVATAKPDPEGIILGCRQAASRPENSIYIGDHWRDIEAGNRAGCMTVAAAYGYLADNDDPAQWGADLVVHSSQELAISINRIIQ